MRKIMPFLFTTIFLLTACNLPIRSIQSTPTPDSVATQVSELLTAAPVLTQTQSGPAATNTPAAPTGTAAPTLTLTPAVSATPNQPTVTPPAGDPKNSLGEPTWHDTLDSSKTFYLYDNGNTKITQENGAVNLTGVTANGWIGWTLTYSHPVQNGYLEMTFTPQTCSGGDLYGIVFRTPDADAGYFYGVTCDGKFNLSARDLKTDTNQSLIPATSNAAIQTGSNQTNRLGIRLNGNQIGLYANGVLLQEISDANFPNEGNFGAFVAANATTGFTVHLDEVSLWKQ